MTADDADKFNRMLTLCAEHCGKQVSPDLLAFYFDALAHIPLASVRSALGAHVRNTEVGQFMPKIADIIRAIEGTGEDAAYAALAQIQSDFRGTNCTDPVAIAVVRDMGGWQAIGQREAEEWQSFGTKDFVRRYRSYKAREERPKEIDDLSLRLSDKMNP